MDHIDVGGLRVAFERRGEGPPLVLLHGWPSNSREWRRQLEVLSDEFTVVAWDAPGAGESSDPPEAFRLADWADCLVALVHALDLGRPHIAGLSWGGGLVLELYRRHPSVPRSLILASAYAGWAGSLPAEIVQQRLQMMLRNCEVPSDQWAPEWIETLLAEDASQAMVAELMLIASDPPRRDQGRDASVRRSRPSRRAPPRRRSHPPGLGREGRESSRGGLGADALGDPPVEAGADTRGRPHD